MKILCMRHFSIIRLTLLLIVPFILSSCTQATLNWASLKPSGNMAVPDIFAPLEDQGEVRTTSDWEKRRPLIKSILEDEIYGHMPEGGLTEITQKTVVEDGWLDGLAQVEEWQLEVTPVYGGESLSENAQLTVSLVMPVQGSGPFPVIMMETFCSRTSAVPVNPEEADSMPGIITFVFGRYICRPPYEDILAKGYAVAVIPSTDVVPDQSDAGLAALQRLSPADSAKEERWGAIAAWGWTFSRVVDALVEDERIDDEALIAWGHSRYGKAALLAAAYDERIDGVISHQSGTGGASLNRRKKGESIKAITDSYPHWFSTTYADFADHDEDMILDQHHLLALIAPRPVLLGNARRDVWSDPNGAFRAAKGATPAYKLYGKSGLDVERLDQFVPEDKLSFWMRSGTHGIVNEDWPAFFRFLDAHFTGSARVPFERAEGGL